jgi:hypothetical protein
VGVLGGDYEIEEGKMGRRLVGTVLFLGVALSLFEVAGRLVMHQKAGWGWFLTSGLVVTGSP